MATMNPEELKAFQRELDMTNQEFADFLGVSKRTVEDWRSSARSITGLTVLALRFLMVLRSSGRDIDAIMNEFRKTGMVGEI